MRGLGSLARSVPPRYPSGEPEIAESLNPARHQTSEKKGKQLVSAWMPLFSFATCKLGQVTMETKTVSSSLLLEQTLSLVDNQSEILLAGFSMHQRISHDRQDPVTRYPKYDGY